MCDTSYDTTSIQAPATVCQQAGHVSSPDRPDDAVLTAVVVPVRCFAGSLSRLGEVLDESERAAVMRIMTDRVLKAASPYPAYVTTHDGEVAEWALGVGARVILMERPGLSAAAALSLNQLSVKGVQRVVIAHADLVLAQTLEPAVGNGFVIVPDQCRDGSNAMCVPADSGFQFSYGPGSFQRHITEAERLGLPVTVVDDPALSFDVDNLSDLRSLSSAKLVELGFNPIALTERLAQAQSLASRRQQYRSAAVN